MREIGREMPHACYLVPERKFFFASSGDMHAGGCVETDAGRKCRYSRAGKGCERTPHRQSVIKVFSVLIAASDRHKPLFYITLFDNREELQTQNGNPGSWLPTR